ncbi:MAG: response regulator, partial [Pseudomonadota bacterium]
PAAHVVAGVKEAASAADGQGEDGTRTVAMDAAVVLLVEDNIVIAMDAEAMLLEMGFSDVLVANTVPAALGLIAERRVDVAVLDINLGNETAIPVAEVLTERGTPVIFASGYGDVRTLPEPLRHVPIVTKPYSETKLTDGLNLVGVAEAGA